MHEATEHYDLMSLVGTADRAFNVGQVWEVYFNAQLEEARAKEPNEHKWASSSAEPIAVWNQIGPQFVQSYIDWRERCPWEIWTTPDGEPAIELDVSGFLPGCPVEIKAYVDRIFWDPVMKRYPIVDLKTGKRPPSNADQFGTYSALTKVKFDLTADLGVPFMNRKGTVGKPFELAEYTPEYVGAAYGEAWEQVQRGDWTANGFPGGCFICDVQSSCALQNGPLAHLYDPDFPGYRPL
ncbi:hypothetical protein AS594_07245 [Streptomyces agglomeratus]|uniref:PD-(D/E)XK endonuclease-like domain-containing protein n=1 Tax=Streptomyces agglomeratus TaxID=285458 RepID=A0A1E5P432_9ACTN|nr:hypothetical protein AS594_07245 [Streptomyces agglomeratus]